MVETCDTCACFPVCDRKFNMFGVFMGWADCNNWIPEVKRGKWKIKTDDFDCEYMVCSWCCAEYYNGDNDTVDTLHNFCPHCGATMCKE